MREGREIQAIEGMGKAKLFSPLDLNVNVNQRRQCHSDEGEIPAGDEHQGQTQENAQQRKGPEERKEGKRSFKFQSFSVSKEVTHGELRGRRFQAESEL